MRVGAEGPFTDPGTVHFVSRLKNAVRQVKIAAVVCRFSRKRRADRQVPCVFRRAHAAKAAVQQRFGRVVYAGEIAVEKFLSQRVDLFPEISVRVRERQAGPDRLFAERDALRAGPAPEHAAETAVADGGGVVPL